MTRLPSHQEVLRFLNGGAIFGVLPIHTKAQAKKLIERVGFPVEPFVSFPGKRSSFSRTKHTAEQMVEVARTVTEEITRLRAAFPDLDTTGTIIDPNNPQTKKRSWKCGRANLLTGWMLDGVKQNTGGAPVYLQITHKVSDPPVTRPYTDSLYAPDTDGKYGYGWWAWSTWGGPSKEPPEKAVFRHELGHTLTTESINLASVRVLNEAKQRGVDTNGYVRGRIGAYASSKPTEMLAEMFSLYTSPYYDDAKKQAARLQTADADSYFPVYMNRIIVTGAHGTGTPINVQEHTAKRIAALIQLHVMRPLAVIEKAIMTSEPFACAVDLENSTMLLNPNDATDYAIRQTINTLGIKFEMVDMEIEQQFLPAVFEMIMDDMIMESKESVAARANPKSVYNTRWRNRRKTKAMITAPPAGKKYVIPDDVDMEGEDIEDYLILVDESDKRYRPYIPE